MTLGRGGDFSTLDRSPLNSRSPASTAQGGSRDGVMLVTTCRRHY